MQLNFFRKGLKSLEAVDSLVKRVAEEQRIDYQFSETTADTEDREDDSGDGYNNKEDGEISFDYRKCTMGMDVSTSGNSTEVSIQHWTWLCMLACFACFTPDVLLGA